MADIKGLIRNFQKKDSRIDNRDSIRPDARIEVGKIQKTARQENGEKDLLVLLKGPGGVEKGHRKKGPDSGTTTRSGQGYRG